MVVATSERSERVIAFEYAIAILPPNCESSDLFVFGLEPCLSSTNHIMAFAFTPRSQSSLLNT